MTIMFIETLKVFLTFLSYQKYDSFISELWAWPSVIYSLKWWQKVPNSCIYEESRWTITYGDNVNQLEQFVLYLALFPTSYISSDS